MTTLEIRPFEPSDEDAVLRLWERCDLLRPWNDPRKDIARKKQVQPDLFLVGLLGGRVVASAMAGYEGHRGWINYLAVDPACQRLGLGRQILLAAEAQLRDAGCPKINLQIRRGNAAVVQFYAALGYREDDVICMGKRLVSDDDIGRG